MNIYSWLEFNAQQKPDKVSIRYLSEEITFSELWKLVNGLGESLRQAGVSRGDHVTIVLPNAPEFIIAYMAIAGIGAVVVPVNPTFTSRELAHIIKDSESKGIILERTNLDTYLTISETCPLDFIITTGDEGTFQQWASPSSNSILTQTDSDDVAAMIYSSGLTGYPMGAMLTHANLDHNSNLIGLCMGVDDSDSTLTIIPCFHSFSASANMLSMLRYGGSVYLMKRLDFKELHYALSEGGVTAVCAVPTLFYGLTHHPDLQDIDYQKMKCLIAGGSALDIEIYNAFKDRFGMDIRQGYGITEASPVCAVNWGDFPIKPESIGHTVPEVEAKIVDENGKVLKPGVEGELLFKGPNIMKGYYNKEKETSEIIKDGWLYTGDLGYMDDEGYLYITGYKKEMIITSGFNVYSKEVVNVLNSLPGVKDSAIAGLPDPLRGSIIKAYIVRADPALSEKDVKHMARKQLASYKTPRKVVFVPEIERDADGKALLEQLDET
ncbi:MAG: AMP-binding protein [Deltaproteobacteria bacterium]|nr:AMP-binding protein [Deltaproteobacteria bacterium]